MINFQKMVSRKHALLTEDVLISAWNDGERMRDCTGIPERVINLEIIDGDFYFDFTWVENVAETYANASLEVFTQFVSSGVSHGEKLKAFARAAHVSDDADDLKRIFRESNDLLNNLLVFLPLTHPLAKALERRVVELLKTKGLDGSDLDRVLLEISYPTKANGPVLEERALREIKRDAASDPSFDLDSALKAHAEMFSYLGYREPFSQGYSADFFRQRLSEIQLEEQTHPTSPLTLTDDERRIIAALQDLVFFRNYRTEKFYEALYFLEPVWKKLAVVHGLNETDIGWYRAEECSALFEKGVRVPPSDIDERKKGYGFLLHDNVISCIVGDVLQQKKTARQETGTDVKELKGMVACSGKVLGTAKILFSAKDQSKINEGDILVTKMTTPDYLPAMKKAVAFITDEGGITCHAAILSREMNKPCIIGTKIATKVLHDGDEVEVDANHGIVKILKRAS